MANQDDRDIVDALRSLSQGEEIEQTPEELVADLAEAPTPQPAAKRPRSIPRQTNLASLHRQQTMIPILLTCTLLLWVFASLRFVVYADSPLARLPLWSSIVGYLGGAVLLMGAVVNMVSVRYQLRPTQAEPRTK